MSEPLEEDPLSKLQWTTTLPLGMTLCTRLDGLKQEVKDILICSATDPQTNEVRQTYSFPFYYTSSTPEHDLHVHYVGNIGM